MIYIQFPEIVSSSSFGSQWKQHLQRSQSSWQFEQLVSSLLQTGSKRKLDWKSFYAILSCDVCRKRRYQVASGMFPSITSDIYISNSFLNSLCHSFVKNLKYIYLFLFQKNRCLLILHKIKCLHIEPFWCYQLTWDLRQWQN